MIWTPSTSYHKTALIRLWRARATAIWAEQYFHNLLGISIRSQLKMVGIWMLLLTRLRKKYPSLWQGNLLYTLQIWVKILSKELKKDFNFLLVKNKTVIYSLMWILSTCKVSKTLQANRNLNLICQLLKWKEKRTTLK